MKMKNVAAFSDISSGAPVMFMKSSSLLAALTLTVAAGIQAAPLDLSRVPPEVNASVPPNVLVSLDDSGSMGFAYIPDSANFGETDCRFYDPAENAMYFNPALDYPPPLRADGTPYDNASPSSAWRDGFRPDLGTENLETQYRASNNHNTYEDYSSGWRTNFPTGASGGGERWAFYCSGGTVRLIQNEPENWQKFANWFSYYRTRSLAARTALTTAFARIDPKIRVARQNFNSNHVVNGSTEIRALEDSTDGFYDWLIAPRFTGGTPMRESLARAGRFFEQGGGNSYTNPYWDGESGELSCRQNFHLLMTDGYWTGGSPNISSETAAIGNYDTSGRQIGPADHGHTLSGDDAMVYYNAVAGGTPSDNPPNMADIAFYFWARDLRTDLDNNVPIYFGDALTGVTGDPVANYGHWRDVPELYFNPANDPADWQRMVNFIVGFGVSGSLPRTAETLLGLRRGDISWPLIEGGSGGSCSLGDDRCRTTIDDAWHAAVNSRGEYLSAQNPMELVDALSALLDNVSQRLGVTGSAGSTAFLRSDTVLFEASYDSGSWSGDILAREINPESGEPTGIAAWDNTAGEQLDARPAGSRNILINVATPTPSSTTADAEQFQWGNLSGLQTYLNANPVTGFVDDLGPERVEWMRGDRSNEQSEGGALRNRISVLGPFIGSSLISVAAPRFGYRGREDFDEGGTAYAQFRDEHGDRPAMLYAGSNDGMLHAFDAETGAERWAFIPNRVVPNLARLTVPGYQFVPFVDNTPIDHDVYINGEWRTVLIGTLGLGGQGIYAIDITDPDNPAPLWEVTDQVDPLMGYTYGRPNVGRLSDGTWVAFVSSGYNAQENIDYATRGLPNPRPDDHHAGSDSDGALFVIRIGDGQVKRIDISEARGLATPQLADYELDFKVDFAVAGDLDGNLWRIDLKDHTWANVQSAGVDMVYQGELDAGGEASQPITSAPTIFPDPASGKMVIVVGSGKYIEVDDRSTDIPRQRIYGIRECGSGGPDCSYPITSEDLVSQVVQRTGEYLTMEETNVVPPDAGGWYLELGTAGMEGERVIDMSIPISFASGIVAIGSFVPSDDPCSPLGTGAIYVLSAFTGGFALSGDLNAAGDAYEPGEAIFVGGGDGGVALLTDRPPDMSAFLNPDGGTINVMGTTIRGVPIRRRSGWREIPMQ